MVQDVGTGIFKACSRWLTEAPARAEEETPGSMNSRRHGTVRTWRGTFHAEGACKDSSRSPQMLGVFRAMVEGAGNPRGEGVGWALGQSQAGSPETETFSCVRDPMYAWPCAGVHSGFGAIRDVPVANIVLFFVLGKVPSFNWMVEEERHDQFIVVFKTGFGVDHNIVDGRYRSGGAEHILSYKHAVDLVNNIYDLQARESCNEREGAVEPNIYRYGFRGLDCLCETQNARGAINLSSSPAWATVGRERLYVTSIAN